MTAPRFYVGERPTEPIVVDVGEEIGTRTPSLVGEGLPAHDVAVDAATTVRVDFTEPFAAAGSFSFQIALAGAAGEVDYTTPVVIEVAPSIADLRVTGERAFTYTGQFVSVESLRIAQAQVALRVDRELSNDTVWQAISSRDQYTLSTAIAWQAVELQKQDESPLPRPVPGVTAMSTGDQSVSFARGAMQQPMSPVALGILKRLSWYSRQISATTAEDEARLRVIPNPWTTIAKIGHL